MIWKHRRGVLHVSGRPLIMGILNTTPDSFSDGGRYATTAAAVARGLEMVAEGADIVDIGGESSRPGATPVAVHDEIKRIVPVVRALREQTDIPISVDTVKAETARLALAAGADIVNDISACRHDPAMAETAIAAGAGIVLMHMQGTPSTMQIAPSYRHVVNETLAMLLERAEALQAQGAPRACLALDPGIGFGKTLAHNVQLLAEMGTLTASGWPILAGASRKRFIGDLTGRAVHDRLAGSLAAAIVCAQQKVAILRVHDVRETRDAVVVAMALERNSHALE